MPLLPDSPIEIMVLSKISLPTHNLVISQLNCICFTHQPSMSSGCNIGSFMLGQPSRSAFGPLTTQFLMGDLLFRLLLIYLFIYSFIYFWLPWVFVAVHGLSLVAVSVGYSLLWCSGFSLQWLPLLWSTGSRCAGFSSCGTRGQ